LLILEYRIRSWVTPGYFRQLPRNPSRFGHRIVGQRSS
jgi:hypothetical protein